MTDTRDDDTSLVPPELRLLVTDEVRLQLDRELMLLKNSASIAIKVVAGAFVLLGGILTVFSLTSWESIEEIATEVVKEKTEELIQASDSETDVKRTLADLVNRAIVSSALARLARIDAESEDPDNFDFTTFELPKSQLDHLRTWIASPGISDDDFRDVLVVLDAQDDDIKQKDATLISQLLKADATSDYSWVRQDESKRTLILKHFLHAKVGREALAIASSAEERPLRLAALEYVQTVGYRDDMESLLALQSAPDEEIANSALIAAAVLKITDDRIKKLVYGLMSDGDDEHLVMLSSIIEGWLNQDELYEDGTEEILTSAKDILAHLFKNKAFIAFRANGGASLVVPQGADNRHIIRVPELVELSDIAPYTSLLGETAQSGSIEALHALLPRNYLRNSEISSGLAMAVAPEAFVKVRLPESEATLKGSQMEAVEFKPIKKDAKDLEVVVTQMDGTKLKGILTGLGGGEFTFPPPESE